MKFIHVVIGIVVASAPLLLQAATYTARNAPDAISAEVLSTQLTRLDQGPLQGADAVAQIHANFPQLVEQNFAALSARDASDLFDSLTAAELSDLAQLYVNAVAESGVRPRLLAVLTQRLDTKRLWRLSQFFGYGPVHDAIAMGAPTKMRGFLRWPRVSYEGPVIGDETFGPQGRLLLDGNVRVQTSPRSPSAGELEVASAAYRGSALSFAGSTAVYRGHVQASTSNLTRIAFGQFLH